MSYISNLTADGQSSEFRANRSGEVRLSGSGTWGGGTLTPQRKASDGTWNAYGSDTLTADGDDVVLVVGLGDTLRADLSGATSPDLDVHFEVVK